MVGYSGVMYITVQRNEYMYLHIGLLWELYIQSMYIYILHLKDERNVII